MVSKAAEQDLPPCPPGHVGVVVQIQHAGEGLRCGLRILVNNLQAVNTFSRLLPVRARLEHDRQTDSGKSDQQAPRSLDPYLLQLHYFSVRVWKVSAKISRRDCFKRRSEFVQDQTNLYRGSRTVTTRSASSPPNSCVFPFGHRISARSTFVASPSPKWRRRSSWEI